MVWPDFELQGMQICEKIADLLLIEHLAVARHFIATETNDIGNPIIVGGHSAHGKILPLKHAFHARPLASPRRVRRVAAIAIAVVDTTSSNLLSVQTEFDIALAPFGFTACKQAQADKRDAKRKGKSFRICGSVKALSKDVAAPFVLQTGKQTVTIIKQSRAQRGERDDDETSCGQKSIRNACPL